MHTTFYDKKNGKQSVPQVDNQKVDNTKVTLKGKKEEDKPKKNEDKPKKNDDKPRKNEDKPKKIEENKTS